MAIKQTPLIFQLSPKELSCRSAKLHELLAPCRVCPRQCGMDRTKDEPGLCKAGYLPEVSSWNLHFGEEPPLSGYRGSGTIFFAHCNLHCCFCQNYPISQLGHGQKISLEKLAQIMLKLQEQGAHNINLVTPTHFVPQIVKALALAKEGGLRLPVVYNSGGYESLETLKLLAGIVDIYMPDAKYGDSENALKYSQAPDYFEISKTVLKEMHRQVGKLIIDEEGVASRGLLIRHLVLPNNLALTERVLKFIAEEISPATYLSLMAQYHPAYKAVGIPELSRRLTREEYQSAVKIADQLGLHNGWRQNF